MNEHLRSAKAFGGGDFSPASLTLGEQLQPLLQSLIQLHQIDVASQPIESIWHLVTEESFALPPELYSYAHSTINGDGLPLQISVSLGVNKSGGLRLLTEAGPLHQSIADRIEATTRVLGQLSREFGLGAAAEAINRGLYQLFPTQEADLAEWQGGAVWIALGFKAGKSGMKFYVNLGVGERRDRWIRAGRTMAAAGFSQEALERFGNLYDKWGAVTELEGFMFEPTPKGLQKVKVYFRTEQLDDAALASLLTDLNAEFDPNLFFTVSKLLAGEQHVWSEHSLVFSYEIEYGSAKTGLKIDMSCSAVAIGDAEWVERIGQVCELLELDPTEYLETYKIVADDSLMTRTDAPLHHRFVGLGHMPGEGVRLNVYFEPQRLQRTQQKASVITVGNLSAALEDAVQEALQHVFRLRSGDGHWSDFQMPVGISDEWVTAYVTAQLASVDPALHASLQSSASWLVERFRPQKGFGYNRFVPADADSTAWSLLALQKLQALAGLDAEQLLTPYQSESGLFATYFEDVEAEGSWGIGHADVTAVALQALLGQLPANAESVRHALDALLANQRADGSFPSFWWKDDFYAIAMASQAIRLYSEKATGQQHKAAQLALAKSRHFLADARLPDEPFAIALWLIAWRETGGEPNHPDVQRFIRHLLLRQQAYGGWKPVPILRLCNDRLERPWEHGEDGGRLYMDQNGLFSTVTVIRALSVYHDIQF